MGQRKDRKINQLLIEFTFRLANSEGVSYIGSRPIEKQDGGEILRWEFRWGSAHHEADLDLEKNLLTVNWRQASIRVEVVDEGYRIGNEEAVISSAREAAEQLVGILKERVT